MKQTYTIRLDTELHSRIKEEALVKGISLSQYIEDMITWNINKPNCPKPPCVKQQPEQQPEPRTREEIIDHVVAQLPDVVPQATEETQTTEDAEQVSQYY